MDSFIFVKVVDKIQIFLIVATPVGKGFSKGFGPHK